MVVVAEPLASWGINTQDEYLLDVADRLGADVPCVCRSGTCASCAVQVMSGSVEYDDLFTWRHC